MNKSAILLVEDSTDIRFLVQRGLEREGYIVYPAPTGADAIDVLHLHEVDAILLDLMLPDVNGLSLIGSFREYTKAPVIVVSAKSQLVERVVGFESGADDYLVKPFQIEELFARVRAHIRRYKDQNSDFHQRKKIRFGRFTMDLSAHRVVDENGAEISFTLSEFNLMRSLVSSPDRVFTRRQLLEVCSPDDMDLGDRSIDTRIARIRKKLDIEDAATDCVRSVRGVGYCYCGSVSVVSE